MQVMQFMKIIKSYSPNTLISSSIVNQVNQALLILTQSKSSCTYTSKSLADLECYAFLFVEIWWSEYKFLLLAIRAYNLYCYKFNRFSLRKHSKISFNNLFTSNVFINLFQNPHIAKNNLRPIKLNEIKINFNTLVTHPRGNMQYGWPIHQTAMQSMADW